MASKLDAHLLPSIIDEYVLDELQGALNGTEGHMKVAFVYYGHSDHFLTHTPEETQECLLLAGDIVAKNCKSKNHACNCELIHFMPLSSPSQHFCDREPSNDHTSWFNAMDEMLTQFDFETSGSFAFCINNHTKTKHNRQQHFWRNWVQYNQKNPAMIADCHDLIHAV